MKPIHVVVFVGIISALLLAGSAALATPPEIIVIDKAQARKAPVTFPHADHAAVNDCVICHHTAKAPEEAVSCFTCHGQDPAAPDPTVSSKKKNPFHIRCIGCHTESEAGPTKCSQCHDAS